MKKKAIVIGATSGIGKELSSVLLNEGYIVGLAGRRIHLLAELKEKHADRVFIKHIDVAQTADAMARLEALIAEMEGTDIIVISAGTGFLNKDLRWSPEKETIDVNVSGFAAVANVALHYFLSKGSGHLAAVSSIAAVRGDCDAPAYSASKAFVSNYLEGLRKKAIRSGLPISVTDIQPGFVDTAMAKGDGLFWVASPEKAARQIYNAITRNRDHVYITKRWRLIGWLLKTMPVSIYNRL